MATIKHWSKTNDAFVELSIVLLLSATIRCPLAGANAPTTLPGATQPANLDALSPEDAAVEAKLEKHVDESRFNAVDLAKALNEIASKADVKVEVDWTALDQAGVKKDSAVTARLREIRAAKALELVFKSVQGEDDEHHLCYRISDAVIHITSRAELNKLRVTRTIDITDLVADTVDTDRPQTQAVGMAGQPIAKGEKLTRDERLDEIKKYLMDNVDTISWKENGGDVGEISIDASKAKLVIVQLPENQRKIAAELKSLRQGKPREALPATGR